MKISTEFVRMVEVARKRIESDPELAIYMLRDYQEIEQMELSDLAWAACRCGNVHKNDALGFFELVDHYIDWHSMEEKPEGFRQVQLGTEDEVLPGEYRWSTTSICWVGHEGFLCPCEDHRIVRWRYTHDKEAIDDA